MSARPVDTVAMRDMAERATRAAVRDRVPDVHMHPLTLRSIADEIDALRRARDAAEHTAESLRHVRNVMLAAIAVGGVVLGFLLGLLVPR